VNCYGLSLQYGCEYIYQSMPKMLSVWLDFGSDFNRDLKKKNNKTSLYLTERKRTFIKMTKLIGKLYLSNKVIINSIKSVVTFILYF